MILAIDIGTTALKTGVIDLNGNLVSFSRIPFYAGDAGREVSAEDWLSSLRLSLGKVLSGRRKKIRAVSVSGNGPTLVPIGENGKPLAPPVSWTSGLRDAASGIASVRHESHSSGADSSDSRGALETASSFFLSRASYFMVRFRDLYDKTRLLLPCPEYISYVLTGEAFAILPNQEYKQYYWPSAHAARLGLDMEKFPAFIDMGGIYGYTAKNASAVYGVPEGIPVAAGGPDFIMSLLGTGCIEPGETCDRAGSSEGINLCSDRKTSDRRLFCMPHVSAGLWNVSAILSASGASVDWILRLLGMKGLGFDGADRIISDVEPDEGGLYFFPHIEGERNALWGAGRNGAFVGLSVSSGRREILRAVVESTGFAVRQAIDAIEENGMRVHSLRMSGGQAESEAWCRMRANITGRLIRVPEIVHSELLGCACVALASAGEYKSATEASSALVRIAREYEPQKERASRYAEAYEEFKRLDKMLGG